jgi:hypothetical protein
MPTVRSKGVTVWGYLLVLGSLFQIGVLISGGYEHYAYLHQEYGPETILIRYWVSWAIKIAGLIAGIGVLKLNDWCRKLAVFNSLFIILTITLKHTYAAYSLHTRYLDHTIGGLFPGVSFASLTWPALIIQRAIDIIFGLLLIYFFTRPQVRKQFKLQKGLYKI